MDKVDNKQWLCVCENCWTDNVTRESIIADAQTAILPIDLTERPMQTCASCYYECVPFRTFFTPDSMVAENEQCMATKATPSKIIKIGGDLDGGGKVGR